MSAVADKLRAARALIERGWTQGAFARKRNGAAVLADSRDATCFCIAGAIMRTAPGFYTFDRAHDFICQAIGGRPDHWNDAPERTQAEVLAAFDRAIELAQAQP